VPFSVEAVLPKGAFGIIGLMVSFAIGALKGVWAWLSLFSRRGWGFSFIITFAAPH